MCTRANHELSITTGVMSLKSIGLFVPWPLDVVLRLLELQGRGETTHKQRR